ncbi:hypothetical protein PR048_001407 [Dryococelus australis]|uniref:Uncharacterized protein n=1 Tax=Dryococelus australis TaxID=614101 RepID=A0ABQ9IIR0_9NEOP|nr:hypothetical protein PR048_001407 [Dryococelus australis]
MKFTLKGSDLKSRQQPMEKRRQLEYTRLDNPLYTRDTIIFSLVAAIKCDLRTARFNTHSHYCFLLTTGSQLEGVCLNNCRAITIRGKRTQNCGDLLPPPPAPDASQSSLNAHKASAPSEMAQWLNFGLAFENLDSNPGSAILISVKIDFKRVYTEVTFAIGSEFIMHALDDSEPIADLQWNTKRIPYCQVLSNTVAATNEQTSALRHSFFRQLRSCRDGVAVRLPAFHIGEPGSILGGVTSGIFPCGNRAGPSRWSACFIRDLSFAPLFHSATAPHPPRVILIGSQDLDYVVTNQTRGPIPTSQSENGYSCIKGITTAHGYSMDSHGITFSEMQDIRRVSASFTLPRKVVSYSAPTETAPRRISFRPSPVPPAPPEQATDRDSHESARATRHCSPPTQVNRVQSQAGSLRISGSGNRAGPCRWSGGLSQGSPTFPALAFRRCSILTSFISR